MSILPDPYTELADHLLELAEAVSTLAGKGLPGPQCISVGFQVADGECDAVIEQTVDTVGRTLTGTAGEAYPMLDKTTLHYGARGKLGPIDVGVYQRLYRKAGQVEAGEGK